MPKDNMKTLHSLRLAVLVMTLLTAPKAAFAHCDTLDGPVVQTARAALGKGDVTPVLKWVKSDDEATIRAVFTRTLEVRKLSATAASLADMYFFETLVRLHRASESEPYTGLQPAGSVEPAIAAADKALETGNVASLVQDVQQRVATGLTERFARVQAAKLHADHDVPAGRVYVEAYVDFIHYYESLHATAESSVAHGAVHQH
jgi:hypothetical protein